MHTYGMPNRERRSLDRCDTNSSYILRHSVRTACLLSPAVSIKQRSCGMQALIFFPRLKRRSTATATFNKNQKSDLWIWSRNSPTFHHLCWSFGLVTGLHWKTKNRQRRSHPNSIWPIGNNSSGVIRFCNHTEAVKND